MDPTRPAWRLIGLGIGAALTLGGAACAAGTSDGAEAPLLDQLQSMPEVREHLLGTADLQDLVLCGMQELGRDRAEDEVYVWLQCGSYRTGPDAEMLSGGADPAVVRIEGRGDSVRVIDVSFPPMGARPATVRRLFPDAVPTASSPATSP